MILQMKQNAGKNEIGIIFSSKENDKSEFINHLAQTCGIDTSIYAIHNPNGASLSSVYHQMLTNGNVKEDIVVTVHDDIEFLKKDWGKELKRLFEENKEYGIIGVAGSAQFDDMGAWWRYSKIYGQVLHRHDGKSWLTTFSPLLDHDLEEVAVIDGLFMAFMPSRIKYIYDPTLNGFDFYDIDFCLDLCAWLRKVTPHCRLMLMCSERQIDAVSSAIQAKRRGEIDDFVFYDVSLDYLAASLRSL